MIFWSSHYFMYWKSLCEICKCQVKVSKWKLAENMWFLDSSAIRFRVLVVVPGFFISIYCDFQLGAHWVLIWDSLLLNPSTGKRELLISGLCVLQGGLGFSCARVLYLISGCDSLLATHDFLIRLSVFRDCSAEKGASNFCLLCSWIRISVFLITTSFRLDS